MLFPICQVDYRSVGVKASAVAGVVIQAYAYDALGRLTSEFYDGFDGSGNALACTEAFAFNKAGNRLRLTHDDRTSGGVGSAGADYTTTSTYDKSDRLQTEAKDVAAGTADDRFTGYEYGGTLDPGTDQTKKTVHQGLSDQGTPVVETTSFAYDVMGRMSQVSVTAGSTTTTVTYEYDANGFRVGRTQGGVTTVYHVDPANHTGYAQVIEEGTDANANRRLDTAEVQKAYTLAADVLTQATATQVLRLLADAHGSVRAAMDAQVTPTAAAVLQQYAYTAYGQDLDLVANPLTSFRYAGESIDAATGLSFNRARWYDPSSGRFGQVDS